MNVQAASITSNVERVRERIARAAGRCGRNADEITLVAVSKTFPAEHIRDAYAAGIRHFGENRVQEWESKCPVLADLPATWHLVGHLQSNKARRAARLFRTIDTVDSVPLAQKLDRAASELGKQLPVLIELRLAPEATKAGVSEAVLPPLAEAVLALPHLRLSGLMAMPPYFEDPEDVRPYFRKLHELRDATSRRLGCALPELSMGMSHDFEVAIEEGATQIRLGTAIFGARSTE
jgi:pyridoxal phosphate enzyme (YggS family)